MTSHAPAAPRPLQPRDAEATRALVASTLGETPYADRVIELLAAAERGDPESRALITERQSGGGGGGTTVVALALFGPVAGASEAWHISMILVSPRVDARDTGNALLDAVMDEVRRNQGRLVVAELPADPVLGRSLSLLRASGFREEGRVADFYSDGVAQLFLRRDLTAETVENYQ